MKTFTFPRCDSGREVAEGMRLAIESMKEEGLWNENTTFEELSNYAGSRVLIQCLDEKDEE